MKATGQKIPANLFPEEKETGQGQAVVTEPYLVHLELPIPPTTNHLFISRGRFRYISPGYKKWREFAGKTLVEQEPPELQGQVHLVLTIHGGKGFPVNRDLDNCFKAVMDLLVIHKVIEGDDIRIVRSVRAEYLAPESKTSYARCTITLRSVS